MVLVNENQILALNINFLGFRLQDSLEKKITTNKFVDQFYIPKNWLL